MLKTDGLFGSFEIIGDFAVFSISIGRLLIATLEVFLSSLVQETAQIWAAEAAEEARACLACLQDISAVDSKSGDLSLFAVCRERFGGLRRRHFLRPQNWDARGSNSESKFTWKMEDGKHGWAYFRVFRDGKVWDPINDLNGRCLDKLSDGEFTDDGSTDGEFADKAFTVEEFFFTLRERGNVVLEEECRRMIPRLAPDVEEKILCEYLANTNFDTETLSSSSRTGGRGLRGLMGEGGGGEFH